MFLKNRKIISKIRRLKITDYAALNCYRNINILRFFKYKYIRNQTCIAVKKRVKVKPDSSFVQTWYGPHPQCYIPSPQAIGLLVPEKEIFKGFYLIWAWRPLFVMLPLKFVINLLFSTYGVSI